MMLVVPTQEEDEFVDATNRLELNPIPEFEQVTINAVEG